MAFCHGILPIQHSKLRIQDINKTLLKRSVQFNHLDVGNFCSLNLEAGKSYSVCFDLPEKSQINDHEIQRQRGPSETKFFCLCEILGFNIASYCFHFYCSVCGLLYVHVRILCLYIHMYTSHWENNMRKC